MKKIEHKFKKKYGQNFLNEYLVIKKIVSEISFEKDDLIVEIGPGSGIMTKELVKNATVLAYEIDTDLKDLLLNEVKSDKLFVIWDDFLKRNIKNDLKEFKYNRLHVVANLPYYITTPIVTKIIDSKINFDNILIMVQDEVANRFCSVPGSKDYSSITVYLNYYFNIEKLFKVSKNCFYPKPKVDSAIVLLKPRKNKIKLKNEELFFSLIKDSFQFKRKTLKNNLYKYNLEIIQNVLKKYNYDLTVRAEQLSIDVFADISNNL